MCWGTMSNATPPDRERLIETARERVAAKEDMLKALDSAPPDVKLAAMTNLLAAKDEAMSLLDAEVTELQATTEATASRVKFRKDEAEKKDKEYR